MDFLPSHHQGKLCIASASLLPSRGTNSSKRREPKISKRDPITKEVLAKDAMDKLEPIIQRRAIPALKPALLGLGEWPPHSSASVDLNETLESYLGTIRPSGMIRSFSAGGRRGKLDIGTLRSRSFGT